MSLNRSYISDLNKEEMLAAKRQALQEFIITNQIKADVVIGGISGIRVSHRHMNLPFKDRRQIEKVLAFELEDYLPFSIDDLVIDFEIIERTKNHSSVLALAAKKDFVADYLRIFEGLEFTPKVIGIDVLALGVVASISNVDMSSDYALVDFGHEKTSICLCNQGKVKSVRTLASGGLAITEALRRDLDLTLQQAEEVKHNYGKIELEQFPIKDAKERKIASSVKTVVDPLMLDVVCKLFVVLRSPMSNQKVSRLFMCVAALLCLPTF